MKHVIDAIHENGIFRQMQSNIIGLSDADIDKAEQIALNRSNFFGTRSMG